MFLEVGNLNGMVFVFLLIMFGPPILLLLIGVAVKSKSKKASKILYILGAVYLVIGLGICGSMLT